MRKILQRKQPESMIGFSVSEMGNITLELLKRGYNSKEIEKIWGGNLMRVFRKVRDIAEKES